MRFISEIPVDLQPFHKLFQISKFWSTLTVKVSMEISLSYMSERSNPRP